MSKYLELGSKFTSGDIKHVQVSFVPDITIDCNPPYIKGVRDNCWISYNPKIWEPNFNTKYDCEKLVGMSLLKLN